MRFKLGFLSGFGAGYYLGAQAGRERYEQINQSLRKLRRSDAFETVSGTVTSVASEGADKAQGVVENKVGNGQGDETPTRTLP